MEEKAFRNPCQQRGILWNKHEPRSHALKTAIFTPARKVAVPLACAWLFGSWHKLLTVAPPPRDGGKSCTTGVIWDYSVFRDIS